MPKHKCPEPEPDNSKAWLDSYADAMTLLLAFFILLFAFSLVDQKKFQEFRAGLHLAAGKAAPATDGGDGILDLGTGISSLVISPQVLVSGEKADAVQTPEEEVDEPPVEDLGEVVDVDEIPTLFQRLVDEIELLGAAEFVELERSSRGVIIRMDAKVLYQSGSAQIVPDGVLILEQIGPVLESVDNPIIVEGHTDSQPTNGGGGFATNWELSTARGVSVLRYMTEFMDFPPARLSATGFADTRPRGPNDTAEGRALNRRVELVVLVDDNAIDVVAAPPEEADSGSIVDISPEVAPELPSEPAQEPAAGEDDG